MRRFLAVMYRVFGFEADPETDGEFVELAAPARCRAGPIATT